jgi:DNA polymerase III subunit epsilon
MELIVALILIASSTITFLIILLKNMGKSKSNSNNKKYVQPPNYYNYKQSETTSSEPKKPTENNQIPKNFPLPTNKTKSYNFIAIDFETANENRLSACAIGMAFIENGTYAGKGFAYIKPPESQVFKTGFTALHRITYDMVKNGDDFLKIWQEDLKREINNKVITFHNASMDLSILKQCFEYYKITDYRIFYFDTMQIAKAKGLPGKLSDLCSYYNISFKNNHDAVADAIACAEVALKFIENGINIELYKSVLTDKKAEYEEPEFNQDDILQFKAKTLKGDILKKDLSNADPENIFYDKKIVFTGNLKQFDRKELAETIRSMGADINTAISKKTDFVIVGNNPGPAKMEMIKKHNDSGANIRIINENELIEILNKKGK